MPPPRETTREKQHEKKIPSGTTGEQKEAQPPTKYAIEGIRSARKVMGPDKVIRWEYEVEWEDCPSSQNTWMYPRELPTNSTMQRWMRLAKSGQSAGREASANRAQVNSVYAILGKTSTMKLPLAHNRSFTREDLLWESVYDSLPQPTDTFSKSRSPSNVSSSPSNDSRAPREAVYVTQTDRPAGILAHHGTRTDNRRLSVSWRPAPHLAEECGVKKNVSTAISPPVSSPVFPSEIAGAPGKSVPPLESAENTYSPSRK